MPGLQASAGLLRSFGREFLELLSMGFHPEEILFMPTADCNLFCPHCNVKRSRLALPVEAAKKFIRDCKHHGIKRIGFTGGEPFLAPDFLFSVTKFAVKQGCLFTTIMTNGVWYRDKASLKVIFGKLFRAGYDGSISISADAYHAQNLKRLAYFIDSAISIWRRPDMISIVYVTGRDAETKEKLSKLSGLLNARLSGFGGKCSAIKSIGIHSSRAGLNLPCHIKITKIDISPVGRALKLKDPWDGRWFKEDYCKGPGNVFLVEPSGEVKPCCGYASESGALSIGNIRKDPVAGIFKNIRQNRLVYAIFNSGLRHIGENLMRRGVKFPGKTSNNCFFCRYILERHEKELYSLFGSSRAL